MIKDPFGDSWNPISSASAFMADRCMAAPSQLFFMLQASEIASDLFRQHVFFLFKS